MPYVVVDMYALDDPPIQDANPMHSDDADFGTRVSERLAQIHVYLQAKEKSKFMNSGLHLNYIPTVEFKSFLHESVDGLYSKLFAVFYIGTKMGL